MAEEITREIVETIVKDAVQEAIQPPVINIPDNSWITGTGLVISALILAVALLKYNSDQKIQHQQENNQMKLHYESERKNQKIEFMKQLEYYDDEFRTLTAEYFKSNQKYSASNSFASRYIRILDRISYLYSKNIIDDDFLYYFKNFFGAGKSYLSWLGFVSKDGALWHTVFPNFLHLMNHNNLFSKERDVVIIESFFYYVDKVKNNLEYFPVDDSTDPTTYKYEIDDFNSLKDYWNNNYSS